MSAPMNYDAEEAQAVMEQDRADEGRRDAQDAIAAGRDADALWCGYCGEEIREEPCEEGDELLHFACWAQTDALADLKNAAREAAEALTDALNEYAWARQHGSAKSAPEKAADALYVKRLGYLSSAIDNKTTSDYLLTCIKLLLYSLHDEERARQSKSGAHAANASSPTAHRIGTALTALEQVERG